MDNFIYDTPTKVYFGKGEEENVGKYIKAYNPNKVLIHYGGESARKSGLLDKVEKALKEEGIKYVLLGGVVPNPTQKKVDEGVRLCKEEGVDFILSIGGGSVLDSGKHIANSVANPNLSSWGIASGVETPVKTLNKGCILTLSAAGSEMSNSCVITNEDTGEKRGYGSHLNRMNFAIENPELTYTVSPYQTACGIVDIGMHTIERYFCPGDNTYLTDSIAETVMKSIMKAGDECLKNPYSYQGRANMMWASSLAHNGLTGCGRSMQLVVHQLEHEISGMYPEVSHGAGLAALWCSWARYVYKANIMRWLQYSKNVWNLNIDFENPEATIEKAIDTQEAYYKSINMPTNIKDLGVKESDLEKLALNTSRNKSRVLIGYKELDYNDILEIFKMAYNN